MTHITNTYITYQCRKKNIDDARGNDIPEPRKHNKDTIPFQNSDNAPNVQIVSTIPDLCNTISRGDRLNIITRKRTKDSYHKACTCVICDCFIVGVE